MIDISIVTTFVSPIIVIACLIVGYLIKHTIENKTVNAFIPCILATLGIIANVWTMGIFTLETLITGAVSGLAATGLYEAFDNILNLPKTDPIIIESGQTEQPQGKHFAKEEE